ncbi:hypothetical protein PAXRUDRAFT_94203, partial [Paxillus rubicundulus Ve08.2h10]
GSHSASGGCDGPDTTTQRGANPCVDPHPAVDTKGNPPALHQSTNGIDSRDERKDAKQGVDRNAR